MLHKLWGKAKDHPDYVKQEWIQLQREMEGRSGSGGAEEVDGIASAELAISSHGAYPYTLLGDIERAVHNIRYRSSDDPVTKRGLYFIRYLINHLLEGK